MGGLGSGRRGGLPTVESSLTLNLSKLVREGTLRPGQIRSGTYVWHDSYTGEQSGKVAYEGYLGAEQGYLRLRYTATCGSSGEAHAMDYRIALTTTRPPFGGVRWWFVCPRSSRQVMKLHLPLGA